MPRGADEVEGAVSVGWRGDAHAAQDAGIGACIGIGFLLEDGARIDALDRAAIVDIGALHAQATASIAASFRAALDRPRGDGNSPGVHRQQESPAMAGTSPLAASL